jgi:hypothetical protein
MNLLRLSLSLRNPIRMQTSPNVNTLWRPERSGGAAEMRSTNLSHLASDIHPPRIGYTSTSHRFPGTSSRPYTHLASDPGHLATVMHPPHIGSRAPRIGSRAPHIGSRAPRIGSRAPRIGHAPISYRIYTHLESVSGHLEPGLHPPRIGFRAPRAGLTPT